MSLCSSTLSSEVASNLFPMWICLKHSSTFIVTGRSRDCRVRVCPPCPFMSRYMPGEDWLCFEEVSAVIFERGQPSPTVSPHALQQDEGPLTP